MDAFSNILNTKKWLVYLEPAEKMIYATVRELEYEFLHKCECKGCRVYRLGRRSSFCLIPKNITPPNRKPLDSIMKEWRSLLRDGAKRERKSLKIGTKSTHPPYWIDAMGKRTEKYQRPAYNAFKVSARTQIAYRSGRLTHPEAIEYMYGIIGRKLGAIENSYTARQKSRAIKQELELSELQDQLSKIKLLKNVRSVRLISGEGLHVNVRYPGGRYSTSISTIALIPVDDNVVELSAAGTRNRKSSFKHVDVGRLRFLFDK